MTLQLLEGQDFAAHYSLMERVAQRNGVDVWLALDTQLSERVLLKVFDNALPEPVRSSIEASIAATRGLVHPSIARLYLCDSFDGHDFLACQYVRGATHFSPGPDDVATQWSVLEQLLDAIAFAHGLRLAHGHLHPGNLLIDQEGKLRITDFGLPSSILNDGDFAAWLSPQVARGDVPDASDDIYSLGQLIHASLTGDTWREGEFESSNPVPEELSRTVMAMLQPIAYERPRDISSIKETLRRFLLGESSSPLENMATYSRATPSTETVRPASGTEHRLPRERRVISAPVAYTGLLILLILAGGIFFGLPESDPAPARTQVAAPAEKPTTTQNTIAAAAEEPQAKLTPLQIARQKKLEEDGTKVANDILRLQVALEDAGVQVWAPIDYAKAVEKTAEADAIFRESAFEEALATYQDAKKQLEALEARMSTVLAENLTRGTAAMQAKDPQTAIEAYTIATAIDPLDSDAKQQLERAENLEKVLEHMQAGDFLENERKLDEARQRYVAARDLDSEWQPARAAVARVDDKIATREFNDVMSKALGALASKEYETASEAFAEAQAILPNSTAPADGLEQIEVAQRQATIDGLFGTAVLHEQAERWPQAVEAYNEILAQDASLLTASRGLERATRRQELDEKLKRLLAEPTLLASDEELRLARRTVTEAARIDNPGDRLKKQVETLSHHISLARIPVTVTLNSDNRTNVTVYKIGELGRIESTSLDLIPGSYTIVGTRPGYRDVEYKLNLLGGRTVSPITISCTEKI